MQGPFAHRCCGRSGAHSGADGVRANGCDSHRGSCPSSGSVSARGHGIRATGATKTAEAGGPQACGTRATHDCCTPIRLLGTPYAGEHRLGAVVDGGGGGTRVDDCLRKDGRPRIKIALKRQAREPGATREWCAHTPLCLSRTYVGYTSRSDLTVGCLCSGCCASVVPCV